MLVLVLHGDIRRAPSIPCICKCGSGRGLYVGMYGNYGCMYALASVLSTKPRGNRIIKINDHDGGGGGDDEEI